MNKRTSLLCLLMLSFIMFCAAMVQAKVLPPPSPRDLPPILPPPVLKGPQEEKPIELVKLDVRVNVSGLEAETITTMAFRNPNNRQLAGDLEFPLQDGAVVTGYALDINGRMVDGVAVTKEKARMAVETEMRQRVDPGLVEMVRGNLFRTRVYPVMPNGERTVRVTTVSPLALSGGDGAYHLPLPRVPLPTLTLEVDVARGNMAAKPELSGFGDLTLKEAKDHWNARAELKDVTPGDDMYIRLPKLPDQVVVVEQFDNENFLFASDRPNFQVNGKAPVPQHIGLAWDASGSRSPEATERDTAVLAELFKIWRDCTVHLAVFRDKVEPSRDFSIKNGEAGELLNYLKQVPNDGGTNLAGLDLRKAKAPHAETAAWLLFTDGLHTMGKGMPSFGGLPVHVIAADERRDMAVQRFIAEATGGVLINAAVQKADAAAASLTNPPLALLRVEAPADKVADVQFQLQPGTDRAMVYARLLGDAEVTLVYGVGGKEAGRSRFNVSLANASQGRLVAHGWAAAKTEALSVFPEQNADKIRELGTRFGLVTPGTSLLVLENLSQYLRHKVMPPASWPEMRQQYLAAQKDSSSRDEMAHSNKIENVIRMWNERVAWWKRDFSVARPPREKEKAMPTMADEEVKERVMPTPPPAPVLRSQAAEPPVMAKPAPATRMNSEAIMGNDIMAADNNVQKKEKAEAEPEAASSSIAVKPWDPATPYITALKGRSRQEAYAAYLGERKTWGESPAFYLDCAGFILPIDKTLGLRVLSNLAELRIEDAALLRVFAWRLQEAGELDNAVDVLEKVLSLRPEEPQSHRDLALALANRLDRDKKAEDGLRAVKLLYTVITGDWQRFNGIEVVVLMELNRLLAVLERIDSSSLSKVDYLDKRLRKLLDPDVRIVLSWDADNTDIDLHVLEPSGERAFYGQPLTSIGGLVSLDFTQGYGPEEYNLRHAKNGVYRIQTNYFSSRQQTLLGPATVTATVFTNYGRPDEKKQILTVRLDKPQTPGKEFLDIGEVTIGSGKSEKVVQLSKESLAGLAKGMSRDEVEKLLGTPEREDGGGVLILQYSLSGGTKVRLGFGPGLLWAKRDTN